MTHLNPFYTVSPGIALTIKEGKPEFKNLTIKKCSMSNKAMINYNEIINENHLDLLTDNIINKSQSHLVNSTLDIQSLPDVFNYSVSSNNEKAHGNKVTSKTLYSGKNQLMSEKMLKKNQSSSTVKCNKVSVKYKPIYFDNNVNCNEVFDINKSHMNFREVRLMNERKQLYLAYVEENRKQSRKIFVLNHGDRKYRSDLRRSYNPYYV